jgi:T-lymphoma invasion and metastasis-inducing protein 1
MSLTTAISDEEDIESNRASPYKVKSGGSAASFNCTGAVRKAGFLSVKKWLLRKKHQVKKKDLFISGKSVTKSSKKHF